MLRVRTLGGLSVERDGVPVPGAGGRRRPLALLAQLAAAGERGVSRAKLVLRLWPESDEERARNTLAQTLRALRRDLGAEELVVGTTELRLNPAVITTDVAEFEQALARGDDVSRERAVGLYGGPFLDGFYVPGAPEFERWVEEERARLGALYARVVEALARAAGERGDYQTEAGWWRKLAATDPLDSRVAVALMEALASAGDRAGALQHARVYQTLVRQELDAAPDEAVTTLADALRGGSWRAPAGRRAVAAGEVRRERATDAARAAATEQQPTSARAGARARVVARGRVAAAVGAVGVAVVVLTTVAFLHRSTAVRALDPEAVVVVPFRVTGADRSLEYLREGMVDLLAAKLTGERGPHADDPRSVLLAVRRARGNDERELPRDAAVRVAQRLGAGQLVLGGVVGSPARLVLNASLLGVPDGRMLAAASVSGSADSLPVLIDRLAAQLLAHEVGAVEQLPSLTKTPLPALRAYVDGEAAYRRGRYAEAVGDFEQALQLDSTFALSAVGLMMAGNWVVGSNPQPFERGLRLAFAARDQLPVRDRAVVSAFSGSRYPAAGRPPVSELVSGMERAVELAPDRAELWYELGDQFFHAGPLLAMADSRQRAVTMFRRALALDSTYAPALAHLVELAVLAGDTAQVRALGERYLSQDSTSDDADFLRWRVAVALHDSMALGRLRARFDRMEVASLERIIGTGQLDGIGLDDVEHAVLVMRGRAGTHAERWEAYGALHTLALNRGRPTEAAAAAEVVDEAEGPGGPAARLPVMDALFGGGDSAAAGQALDRLAIYAEAPRAAAAADRAVQFSAVCAVEMWRVAHGDLRTVSTSIARLRSGSPAVFDSATVFMDSVLCAALLEAMSSTAQHAADAPAAVQRLDSLSRRGRREFPSIPSNEVNLVVARLWEAQGNPSAALAAVRRRWYHWLVTPYLATYLREEGRLAALVGDRTAAIRAYRHYLALRTHPERALVSEMARVRAELARLERG